jgi:hypothetical protein
MGMQCSELAQVWLDAFGKAVAAEDRSELQALFSEKSYWRDQFILTWDALQFHGREAVLDSLLKHAISKRPANFRVDKNRPVPVEARYLDHTVIEVFFLFDIAYGAGQGFMRLVRDETSPVGCRCFTIGTDLAGLRGVKETFANRVSLADFTPREPIHGYTPQHCGQTFSQFVEEKKAFKDHDPDVLIIGGGHTGMAIGARLECMGASYLIVDRTKRPGDSWRARYESLALHTVGAVNNLPYLRSPDVFPDYVPKELWADWLESYAKLMRLNYWSQTEVEKADFDEEGGVWKAQLRLADGSMRIIRPRHIVLATGGIGARPREVRYPGLEDFAGQKLHSKYFRTGKDFAGKRVIVIGSATSAFDICLDLHRNGAFPTMAQRSGVSVVPLEEGVRYNQDYLPGRLDMESADLKRASSAIYPLMIEGLQRVTVDYNQRLGRIFAGLRAKGLVIDDGPDNTGWLMKLFRWFKGFYINMGCVEAILDDHVKILQVTDIDRFLPEGVKLTDGSVREFDAVVFAVGFMNSNEDVVEIFGNDVAEKVGPCTGLDETGEPIGLMKPLRHRQIWQMYGGLNDCRRLSRSLALQIIAQLKGYVPPLERQPDNCVRPVDRAVEPA